MNFTGNKVLNKIVAILAIIAMTLSDFLFAGANLISYAVDKAKTNSDNVQFSCYFVEENGEKQSKVEKDINAKDIKMRVEISVKNEGYLSGGKITLGNSNFKIKDKVLSEDVTKIESNTAYLNTIKAGMTSTIDLELEENLPESMSAVLLNAATDVVLEGNYTNSKYTQEPLKISGSTKTEIDWKSSEGATAETTLDVLTNKVFEIDGQSKRIVQLLVTSKLTNNNYPVKNTKININAINASQVAEQVTVEARDTSATNGNKEFTTQNYNYNKEDGTLKIDVTNGTAEGTNEIISFKRNAIDKFIVTYIYPEGFEAEGTEYIANTVIVPYDNKAKVAENKAILNEIKDGTVTYSIESNEKEIYKGKIYTGEDRSYESTTKINVNKAGIAEKIKATQLYAIYETNYTCAANILFSQSKILKSEFEKIFGTEGHIVITNNEGTVIKNITKETEADQNGYINISYPENVKEVIIETSRPISEGTLNIINTKTIRETAYDREKVREFKFIAEHVDGTYFKGDDKEHLSTINKIELKDTSSKATLEVTNKSFSTTERTNTRISVILETDKENKDLYKNPTVKVTVPKQVKEFDISYELIHGNGLNIADEKNITEGENSVVLFTLAGEQQKYVTDITEGATLIIDLSMKLDNLAASSVEEIKVNYTNEFASTYADNGEEKAKVKIIAKNTLITASKIKINELNESTLPTEETKDIELDVDSEAKVLTQTMDIVNNEDNKIKDVKILGKYPTNNSKNNMGITINVPASSITKKGEKIYYSTEENPTVDLTDENNKWTEKYSENDKSYLIVIDSMEVAERFTYGFKMNIPANLKHNLSAETGYTVSYRNEATNTNKNVKATTVEFNTGKSATIEQKLVATVGNEEIKNGDAVKTGEIIKYTLTVANTGNEDATGVNIVGNIPEGTNFIEYNKNIKLPDDPVPESEPEMFVEEKDRKQVKFENQTIKAKTQQTFEYMVKVNTTENKNSESKISVTTNNKTNDSIITHKLEASDIQAIMLKSDSIYGEPLKAGYSYRYIMKIKNTSNKEKKDIKVNVNTNKLMTFKVAEYEKDNESIKKNENTFTINSIKPNEEINIMIMCSIEQPTEKFSETELYAVISDGNNTYKTNTINESATAIQVEAKITSKSTNKAEGYLKIGDKVQYTINIKNIGKVNADDLRIADNFSNLLNLESVKVDDKEVKYELEQSNDGADNYSIITIETSLDSDETKNVTITAVVDEIAKSDNIVKINNSAIIFNEVKIAETNEVTYLVENAGDNMNEDNEPDKEENDDDKEEDSAKTDGKKQDNNGSTNKGENKETKETYSISGTAWKDANENGSRDKGEELVADIEVKLLNVETKQYIKDASGKDLIAKTNSEGLYTFTKVPEGKYIAIFEFDSAKYMLTTYKAKEIENDRNSDVILNTIMLDGKQMQLATTDTLNVNNSIANIDIGLIDAKVFDLELEKYITKIVVTNNQGTNTYEYKDATLAKADIAAKNLKDSQVVVEYTIKIRNNGEIAGYVKSVVDYKPTDLSFSSTLNTDWYAQGDNLYNASLANTKLEPGETKELKLVLTKTMTESNTGLVGNTAEIAEAYNTRGLGDKDSTPGNKEKKEDDMGQADMIIGVKTGAAISYILITLSIITIIGVAGYLVSKKVLNKEIKFE